LEIKICAQEAASTSAASWTRVTPAMADGVAKNLWSMTRRYLDGRRMGESQYKGRVMDHQKDSA
jgi:hypothetical protein